MPFVVLKRMGFSLGCPPSQDAVTVTTRIIYSIFRIGNPDLNLHLPLESWEGGTTQVLVMNYCFYESYRMVNGHFNHR